MKCKPCIGREIQNTTLNTLEQVHATMAIIKPSSCVQWSDEERSKLKSMMLDMGEWAQQWIDLLDGFAVWQNGELVKVIKVCEICGETLSRYGPHTCNPNGPFMEDDDDP